MKLIIKGRKIEITDGIREKVNKKIGKLDKFFDDDTIANVTLKVEKDRHILELTIFSKGMLYRAEYCDTDMYVAIDNVVDIIEGQIRKNKTRLEKKVKRQAFDPVNFETPAPAEEEFKVVKRKQFSFKPMSVEEAILQMNLLGHQFFVFSNAEDDDRMNVVYKRKDGNYGLIEEA